MSFTAIIALVLVALVLLSLLFIFFKVFFALLPVALIAIVIIWLFYKFTGRKNDNMPSSGNYYDYFRSNSRPDNSRPRKRARNVKTKDVDK